MRRSEQTTHPPVFDLITGERAHTSTSEPNDSAVAGGAASSSAVQPPFTSAGHTGATNSAPVLICAHLLRGTPERTDASNDLYEDELPTELIVWPPTAFSPEQLRSPPRLVQEPNTPPPNYHGAEAQRPDSPLLFASIAAATPPRQTTVNGPMVSATVRSALLQLRPPGSPVVSNNAGTHSPPPTYPSPPRYLSHTPPPFQGNPGTNETEMTVMGELGDSDANLEAMADMEEWARNYDRDAASREPLADETAELAPAYKDDVGFVSGVRRTRHVACFMLTVALYALVALYFTGFSEWLTDTPRNFQVVLFAAYAVYIIEAFGCVTSVLLWDIRTAPQASEFFYKMMDAAPFVKWSIRCYHLRRAVEPAAARPTDKVVSYSRTSHHELHGCADETPLRFFTSHHMCLYTFAKTRRWRDGPAEARYEEEKDFFVNENSKDDHYDLEEDWGLDEFEDSFLAARPGQEPPIWATWKTFMIFTMLGVSLFYRVYFASKIGRQNITFKKVMW